VNENAVKEVLDELFGSVENLETQSAAILQFLKSKGLASEEDLARQLELAGKSSNVRWVAAGARIDHLVFSAIKREKTKSPESPGDAARPSNHQSGDPEARQSIANPDADHVEGHAPQERGDKNRSAETDAKDAA
jgi:hypothetical protein